MIGQTARMRLVGPLALTSFIAACAPQDVPPPDGYIGGPSGSRRDAGGDATAPSSDASGASDGAVPRDDTGNASDGSASRTPFQGFDVSEIPPYPADASYNPVRPDSGVRGGGDSTVCYQQMAWWMTGAMLDAGVVSSAAAATLNPLLSLQHPLTLADYVDSSGHYWLQISGTETNGVQQQFFPYQYATAPASLVISPSQYPVLTATPPNGQQSGGWIRLVDSSQSEVWIEITQVAASATAGDPLCQTLTNGSLTAIIPATSGNTPLVINGASTTVSQVFGATTATAPPGWSIGITFTATKTQGTFK
jgi:hypothetical protein